MDEASEPQAQPDQTVEPADAAPVVIPTAERLPSTAAFEVTLDEFCNHRLGKDRRHELIGGFRYVERQAGRAKDTIAAFTDRFLAFADAPAPKN